MKPRSKKPVLGKLKFDGQGLIPMVLQDAASAAVLSLFYANAEAVQKMRRSGYVWRYSRSQKKLMQKGETSGNRMQVVSISADCDSDALLVKVQPQGPACHTGRYSCFSVTGTDGRDGNDTGAVLSELISVIRDRKRNPKKDSYTSSIVRSRSKIIAKLKEECGELIRARTPKNIRWEAADLLYFMLVYLENRKVGWRDVLVELKRRRKTPKR